MRAMSLSHWVFWLTGACGVVSLSACNDPFDLGRAFFENSVDTTTIFALRGTAIQLPSAFDIVVNQTARTDRAEPFDFAFDIDANGRAVLLPARTLGFSVNAGILVSDSTFDAVTDAPLEGYTDSIAVAIQVGDIFVARSRVTNAQCGLLGSLPRYGKFRVLVIDTQQRLLTVETLVNINCGFRGLEPGTPID